MENLWSLRRQNFGRCRQRPIHGARWRHVELVERRGEDRVGRAGRPVVVRHRHARDDRVDDRHAVRGPAAPRAGDPRRAETLAEPAMPRSRGTSGAGRARRPAAATAIGAR